jgi:hypothetical protein
MARMSTKLYLGTYLRLRYIWRNYQMAYSYLLPQEQQYLHGFFHLSKDLSPEELLAHRKAITAKHPSLPQQAGKALKKFKAILLTPASLRPEASAHPPGKRSTGPKRIQVYGVINPEPNPDALVQALLMLGREMAMKNRPSPTTDAWLDSEGLRRQDSA